jgi:7-cyano-7-deazaguanine reductase
MRARDYGTAREGVSSIGAAAAQAIGFDELRRRNCDGEILPQWGRIFSAGASDYMGGMTHYTEGLSQLGAQTAAPTSPETAVLERVPNPHADTLYLARFTAPEFTSLCPVTGQPDFAHIVIDYAPGDWLVESKSLKLYLTSFRNHGAFHEDCTVAIGRRLADLLAPKWLRIGGYWYPRGGIPIDVFWQTGAPPEGLWLPDQGVPTYRGRG